MCGIAGGYWTVPPADINDRLSSALLAMRHRGPNDQGAEIFSVARSTLALGQTRLSIIDLSLSGHQPMWSPDRRYLIVFNGEIYNYRELRTELAAEGVCFLSDSDTEVLLHAWIRWGAACLPRLVGMFAFVVADLEAGSLVCVRDAFGIKPFYYSSSAESFLFASEQPALLSLRKSPVRADLQRAYDYLVHGDYDSNSRTFIGDVNHLQPGHLLEADLKTGRLAKLRCWWRPDIAERTDLSFAQATDAVREMFLDNVRFHLRSDVPLGAALSGGIDSSAVVCAMRQVEPQAPIHTFSYIASGTPLSEESWVDLVNAHVGAIGHKVTATATDLARDLDEMIQAQGEPFGSTSIYAQYRVFQLARENNMTVMLEGQGADELLAGYWGYPGYRMRSLMEHGSFAAMHRFACEWGAWPGRSYRRALMYFGAQMLPQAAYKSARCLLGRSAKPNWLKADLFADAGVRLEESRWLGSSAGKGRRLSERLTYEAQERVLPSLLRHGDRNAMHFSIEGRVPFLTNGLAGLLLSLPENYLISDKGETKSVFRCAMRGIVPDAILDRKDKIGFATPERDWFVSIAPTMRSWLSNAQEVPFLNQDALLAAFDGTIAGRTSFSWQVWRWVNYVRWYQLTVQGSA
ncbi:MAG: asparagine synthase (glutamine-hydrolyzing) [Xanthobacteraceae bacterium]